jgi:hypothetical protein
MTIFWDPAGPLVKYDHGILAIEDLNPEAKLRWRMSRMEMLRLGWRCVIAAVRG